MVSTILISIALAVSLFIQDTASIFAVLWWPLFMAACGIMLFTGKHEFDKSAESFLLLAWLFWVCLSGFLMQPVWNGIIYVIMLTAVPILAIALMRPGAEEIIKKLIIGCFCVLFVYAVNLIYQRFAWETLNLQYGKRAAWPLLNPNNAAAMINSAFVPMVCLLIKDRKPLYLFLSVIFGLALYATQSRGGILGAGIALTIFMMVVYPRLRKIALGGFIAGFCAMFYYPASLSSLLDRVPIWEGSLKLLFLRPFSGLGLGTFPHYYKQVRLPEDTQSGGWYAHNDILQFAIEMGIPSAIILTLLCFVVAVKTKADNIIPACAMLAIMIHTMISFHLYLVPVNIVLALAFVCWVHLKKERLSDETF